MAESAPNTPARSSAAQALARFGPGYAALIGLVALAILAQGVLAGVFIEPGAHSGALNAHDINADVTLALSIVAAIYASVLLRTAAPSLVVGSIVLVCLVIALVAIGHAITGSSDHGLAPVHVPLALLTFGLTIWLSVRARNLRRSTA
jgi:hypothetical protein